MIIDLFYNVWNTIFCVHSGWTLVKSAHPIRFCLLCIVTFTAIGVVFLTNQQWFSSNGFEKSSIMFDICVCFHLIDIQLLTATNTDCESRLLLLFCFWSATYLKTVTQPLAFWKPSETGRNTGGTLKSPRTEIVTHWNVHALKCPRTKMSKYWSVPALKCPHTEMSALKCPHWNVHALKYPSPESQYGKCQKKNREIERWENVE